MFAEYKEFMDKHDKNILVAFGMTFMPGEYQLNFLISVLKQLNSQNENGKKIGFIISMRDTKKIKGNSIIAEAIERHKLSNVLLKPYVPQRRLL